MSPKANQLDLLRALYAPDTLETGFIDMSISKLQDLKYMRMRVKHGDFTQQQKDIVEESLVEAARWYAQLLYKVSRQNIKHKKKELSDFMSYSMPFDPLTAILDEVDMEALKESMMRLNQGVSGMMLAYKNIVSPYKPTVKHIKHYLDFAQATIGL